MKLGPTTILKVAVVLIGLPVLAICLFLIPQVFIEFSKNQTLLDYFFYAIFLIMYATSVPFFLALRQAFKLLNVIDGGEAFTEKSVQPLGNIKKYALAISIVYIAAMPLFYAAAEKDDAPGLIVVGMFIAFMSFTVATFAALCQKLFKAAIDIKSENDLTV